jgi:hypothetical protein
MPIAQRASRVLAWLAEATYASLRPLVKIARYLHRWRQLFPRQLRLRSTAQRKEAAEGHQLRKTVWRRSSRVLPTRPYPATQDHVPPSFGEPATTGTLLSEVSNIHPGSPNCIERPVLPEMGCSNCPSRSLVSQCYTYLIDAILCWSLSRQFPRRVDNYIHPYAMNCTSCCD